MRLPERAASFFIYPRTSPNVNRNSIFRYGFSAIGQLDDGRIPTERPHSFKISGAYTFDWSRNNASELSGFQLITSGTPVTSRFTFEGVTGQILNGRGDLGRTEAFTQTDFAGSHK